MEAKIVFTDYHSVPARIMATLTIEDGEKLEDDLIFQSNAVAGCWKVYDFARDAPNAAVENDRKFLVVMAEVGKCEALSMNAVLNPALGTPR
jgi:hypothetical protein